MSGCRCFSSVSRAMLMTARDARHTTPPQALSWWKHKVTTMGKLGVGGEWPLSDLRRLTRTERVHRRWRWRLRLGGGPRSRSPGARGTTAVTLALVSLALAIHWRWCVVREEGWTFDPAGIPQLQDCPLYVQSLFLDGSVVPLSLCQLSCWWTRQGCFLTFLYLGQDGS